MAFSVLNILAAPLTGRAEKPSKGSIKELLNDFVKGAKEESLIDLDYLGDLVAEAGISVSEAKAILCQKSATNQVNQEATCGLRESDQAALAELWACALIKRILNKKQMSARYDDFLKTINRLLTEGKINIGVRGPRESDATSYYHPMENSTTIVIKPQSFASQKDRQEQEAVCVHELFHAYQDYWFAKSPNTEIESEAYLAESDYLAHIGCQLSKDCMTIESSGNESRYYVYSPKSELVLSAFEKSCDSPEYNNALKEIRGSYLMFDLFIKLALNANVEKVIDGYFEIKRIFPLNLRVMQAEMQRAAEGFERIPSIFQGLHLSSQKELLRSSETVFFFAMVRIIVDAKYTWYEKSNNPAYLRSAQADLNRAFDLLSSKVSLYIMLGDNVLDSTLLSDGIE